MKENTLAIDPGKSGGFAWTYDGKKIFTSKIPETRGDTIDVLRLMFDNGINTALIEKVGFHRQGNSASSSVKFARNCEMVEAVCQTLGYEIKLITPTVWQKKLGSLPKDRKDRKNEIKHQMQMKYPYLKVTLATADAVAILDVS